VRRGSPRCRRWSTLSRGEEKQRDDDRQHGRKRRTPEITRDSPTHRSGVPREPARRARDLDLRGARRRCHHAPGLPQLGAHGRPPVRRAARSRPEGRAHDRDGHRLRRLRPALLPRADKLGGAARRARRDRRVGTADVRLARTRAGLQGGRSSASSPTRPTPSTPRGRQTGPSSPSRGPPATAPTTTTTASTW